jgi:hypothetical protein
MTPRFVLVTRHAEKANADPTSGDLSPGRPGSRRKACVLPAVYLWRTSIHFSICWHPGNIPCLMHALGAKAGTYPDPWERTVFDLIFKLDYPLAGPPNVTKSSIASI